MKLNSSRRSLIAILSIAILATISGLPRIAAAEGRTSRDSATGDTKSSEAEPLAPSYKWNVGAKELPLLGLNEANVAIGFEQSLGFSTAQFDFLIFKALTFDEEHGTYFCLRPQNITAVTASSNSSPAARQISTCLLKASSFRIVEPRKS